MNAVVEQALTLWGMTGARHDLVAARENQVFRVTSGTATCALRLHRKGYRTDQELWSELGWMARIAEGGIAVPAPIPSASGKMMHVVDGYQVDVLTWLSGETMADIIDGLGPDDRSRLFGLIGQDMARLHGISDAWTPPEGFVRSAWDREGLVGEHPLWDRFWDNPTLKPADRALFIDLRDTAGAELARIEGTLDYGLIHADLVSANVMLDGDRIQFIDFDDGGYGFRLFDLATTLLKFTDDPDFPALRAALIEGYTSVRRLDLTALDLFMALRAATYAGWIIQRMDEDQATARNARFVAKTRQLAQGYLDTRKSLPG